MVHPDDSSWRIYPKPRASASESSRPRRRPSVGLLFWSAYLVFSPFRVFESGYPQPADLVMALFMGFNLALNANCLPNPQRTFTPLLWFVAYVIAVNLLWFALLKDTNFLLSSAYFIYNGMITYTAVILYLRNGDTLFAQYTKCGLFLAIMSELIIVLIDAGEEMRKIGTFNDPNQLGYWAVLMGSCWMILKRDEKLTFVDGIVLSALLLQIMASVSRSSMLAFFVLALAAILSQKLTRPAVLGLLVMGYVGFIVGATMDTFRATPIVGATMDAFRETSDELVGHATDRWIEYKSGGGGDETFTDRGYVRIWLFPGYLLFGAGEGGLRRFHKDELEVHSSLGGIFFHYGIVGFVLFVSFLGMLAKGGGYRLFIYMSPFLVYGVFNYGLRFSIVWVLFGIMLCMKLTPKRCRWPKQTGLSPINGSLGRRQKSSS